MTRRSAPELDVGRTGRGDVEKASTSALTMGSRGQADSFSFGEIDAGDRVEYAAIGRAARLSRWLAYAFRQ